MSHELEFTNGTANVLARDPMWHKLGQVVGDAFDIATMAERVPELVMPVRMEPVYARIDGAYVELPETACTVRADGKIVGEGMGKESYTIVQQRDIWEWAAEIAQLGDFPFVSAGLIREGHQFFATLDAGGFGIAGLRVNSHLTAYGSHDRTLNVGALYSHIVAICANTFAAAQASAKDRITIRHTASVEERMKATLAAIKGVREWQEQEQAIFEKLAAVRLTTKMRTFDLAVDAVMPSLDAKARGAAQREEAREALRVLATAPVVADSAGTGLGFVQAVNTWENWNGTVRGRKGRPVDVVRAERQFDAVAKGTQPLTAKAIGTVLIGS